MHENERQRPRVLLLAYYCQPNRGSEYGAGWNRAIECAKNFDTWVITRGSETADRIEDYLRTNGNIAELNFNYVHLPAWQERLLELPWIKWLFVRWWHYKALCIARQLHKEQTFDLVQHVTCISYREPGQMWKLGPPFVWGPIGGAESLPWRFLLEGSLVGAASETVRNLVNFAQLHWSRRVSKVAQRASALLFTNSDVQARFERAHHASGPVLQDIGIRTVRELPREPRNDSGPFRILWSGALEPRKGLSLLLKALAKLPPQIEFTLRVLGEGTMERGWKRQAKQLGIGDRTEWLGWLPLREAHSHYQWADAFVFTSLRDTGGNVNLEAMSNGLPVICLDHQGVHDLITDECGIKIPVTSPRRVVNELGNAIARLAHDPQLRISMGTASLERAREYLWIRHGEVMLEVYRDVLAQNSTETGEKGPANSAAQSSGSTAACEVGVFARALAVSHEAIRHFAVVQRSDRRPSIRKYKPPAMFLLGGSVRGRPRRADGG